MFAKNWLRTAIAGLAVSLMLASGASSAELRAGQDVTGKAATVSQPAGKSAKSDPKAAQPKEKTSAEKRQDARTSLEAAAKKAGLDMKRVRKFCDDLEARKVDYSVSDEQVAKTYKAVEGLIDTPAASPFCDKDERNKLAEETLHNLAKPMEIDQGSHPTCNVTTLEVYLASRHPDVYADLVKQVAITQKYKTSAGQTIDLPKKALLPGVDEKAFDIDHPNKDKRNRASQFVEMTLVNGVYETGRYKRSGTVTGQDYRYVMGPQTTHTEWNPQWGWVTVFDTEDRLIDGQGNAVTDANGKAVDQPNFTTEEVLCASEMVLGYRMAYINAPYQISGQPWVYDLPDAQRLLKLKAAHKLPLGVPTKGGIHVQTIHDVFVDSNGQCWVLIDNQHGAAEDGWVTLQELHQSQQNANYTMKPRHTRPQP